MIRDEALDSWGGDDQMHESKMWGVWGTKSQGRVWNCKHDLWCSPTAVL